MSVAYLDASAIVKLVVTESESASLVSHLHGVAVRVTSALARTEVIRATTPHDLALEAQDVLRGHQRMRLDDDVLDMAARLEPQSLRSLDAIHLASALVFGDELDEFITYDRRLAEAARRHGLNVVAPA